MTLTLADAIFWIAVVACAVAQSGILRATAAASAARAAAPTHAAPTHRAATRAEEALWIALPVLALTATLFLTWRALHPRPDAAPAVPALVTGSAA